MPDRTSAFIAKRKLASKFLEGSPQSVHEELSLSVHEKPMSWPSERTIRGRLTRHKPILKMHGINIAISSRLSGGYRISITMSRWIISVIFEQLVKPGKSSDMM